MGTIAGRAAGAAIISLMLALTFGPKIIGWLAVRFREPNKSPSRTLRALHQFKQRTPTMGGLLIVGSIVGAALVFGDWRTGYIPLAVLTTLGFAAIGAADDLTKVATSLPGLSAKAKLAGQCAVALLVAVLLYRLHGDVPGGLDLKLPLVGVQWSLGWLFIPWAAIVLIGSSNAVNLTDGLDGLAGGCMLFATAAMAAIIYVCGDASWAHALNMTPVPGAAELIIIAAGMFGGVLGFLWFNCHPASVFMGDTGSLPLGALLGLLALAARQELLLLLVGGVFVAEALSVIVQVGWFKLRNKRVLLCAPLHHHFQFKGWSESKIVVRFWIASALCAVSGLTALKLNSTGLRMSADETSIRTAHLGNAHGDHQSQAVRKEKP